jgi:hypothetical protein
MGRVVGQIAIDGMGTQRAIARQIIDQDGDYILSDKGNQGRHHDEFRDQFAFAVRQLDAERLDAQRWSFARTKDGGHDRSEVREILVCHNLVRPEGDNPKRPKSPLKRELRVTLDPSCLERLFSLM